ncbi:metallophosphoesterase family protein [Ktedonospora formicarum]|uniref:Serine/threonine protein phosphatase n=1 Tax=Ktedonospora formicarum TaxID=2778364 RepID=A0A8J3I2Q9_9CHLR|nr:metallophosphoesterase family protein [Ktedonospora formicarum]GHO44958.1 serine/threonine protein phosphatase [Ktedonospora formicarum]
MRIALLSDIHGNLPALEAVLNELAHEHIDQYVCLGDVAASGPQPCETLDAIRLLNGPVIMGNTDDWLLSPQVKEHTTPFAQRCQDIDLWCVEQLSEEHRTFIRSFQPSLLLPLAPPHLLLAYHGSPRSYSERILDTTSETELDAIFGETPATILVGGHTHAQLWRRYRDKLILNPGSIGLAMDRVSPLTEVRNPPWAEYAILTLEGKHLSADLRRTPFDVQRFLTISTERGMPHADWANNEWKVE